MLLSLLPIRRSLWPAIVVAVALVSVLAGPVWGQTFDSGSTGEDGALVLDAPGAFVFDPASFDPPLDADGDGIYHFTELTIGADTAVVLKADVLGSRPVVWLVSGDASIAGLLNLDGENGGAVDSARPTVAGAGGYSGGAGASFGSGALPGDGPGGGGVGDYSAFQWAGGGGHASPGGFFSGLDNGGREYGNRFLLPLLGGSGGGGAGPTESGTTTGHHSPGGAGGGALMIAATGVILFTGDIRAYGGDAGRNSGAGSGGAVRLVGREIQGNGTIRVRGGDSGGFSTAAGGRGGDGWARLEAFQNDFSGNVYGVGTLGTPGPLFPPSTSATVRIARVAGVDAPARPVGRSQPADLVIDESGPVTLEIEAANVPLGTVVQLVLTSEGWERLAIESTPLTGTLEASTATATVTIPSGFSRFSVTANWTP